MFPEYLVFISFILVTKRRQEVFEVEFGDGTKVSLSRSGAISTTDLLDLRQLQVVENIFEYLFH